MSLHFSSSLFVLFNTIIACTLTILCVENSSGHCQCLIFLSLSIFILDQSFYLKDKFFQVKFPMNIVGIFGRDINQVNLVWLLGGEGSVCY